MCVITREVYLCSPDLWCRCSWASRASGPAVDQDVVRLVGPGVPVVQDESLTVGLKKLLGKVHI